PGGQHHPGLDLRPAPGVAEVGDLRLLVQVTADPVAHEGPHHPEAVALAVRLYRVGNVAEPVPGAALHDGLVEAFAGDVQQLLHARLHRAHRQGDRAVRVVALDDASEIEAHDVALS